MEIELSLWINVTRAKDKQKTCPRPCSTLQYTGEEMSVYNKSSLTLYVDRLYDQQ